MKAGCYNLTYRVLELDGIDNGVPNLFPFAADFVAAVKGDDGKLIVIGEESHLVVDLLVF